MKGDLKEGEKLAKKVLGKGGLKEGEKALKEGEKEVVKKLGTLGEQSDI